MLFIFAVKTYMNPIYGINSFQKIKQTLQLLNLKGIRNSCYKMGASTVDELTARFKKSQKVREYNAHTSKVHSVDWSSDGRKLASGDGLFLAGNLLYDWYTHKGSTLAMIRFAI